MSKKAVVTPRSIVDEVLGRGRTREIWSGSYDKVIPVTAQDFDLRSVLPAVMYMFRFGHRRGRGRFLDAFTESTADGASSRSKITIEQVASFLAQSETFQGVDGSTEQAILGDLLLAFNLENAGSALGRNEPILRASPAHYMASWLDLPRSVAHLRFVPEMLVAMLADQKGHYVEQNQDGDRTWFQVGRGFEENVLLRVFHQGVVLRGELESRTSDAFDERAKVGIDQLLMIRIAQRVGQAPDKLRGKESGGEHVSNQRPIAERAARDFSEDLRRFIRGYATETPRHAFVEMLESCIAVGLTTIITSVFELLFAWRDSGEVLEKQAQQPACLFVDCSNGVNRQLRGIAERSMDEFMRRIEWIPVILMALRVLDHGVRFDPQLRKLDIPTRPYATAWLNLLGDVLFSRREEARAILYDLERDSAKLADALSDDYPEAATLLRDDRSHTNPVWRIAEALTWLQGRKNTQNDLASLFDSSLLANRPNGLAWKRNVTRIVTGSGRKKRDARSLRLTDPVLEYLVHRHVLRTGKRVTFYPLALVDLLRILRERHGFYVDVAPPGMQVSNELLRENRSVLERRLRDLGLLLGVNDAESMKQLRPRFTPGRGDAADVD